MIFIAGSTGFVGRHLIRSLENESQKIRCLVRSDTKAELVRSRGFEAVKGDITDASSLHNALDGIDTVVHLVGIIEEKGDLTFENVHVKGTNNLINESLKSGVRRFFYQSALGSNSNSPLDYLRTKAEAEQAVLSSGIPFTIFRPSLIVGEGDGFTEKIKQLLSAGPVVPVPGNGLAKFQPLYIHDWIRCFLKVVREGPFSNQTYSLGGPEQLTYNEILAGIMEALAIKKPVVHIPMSATRLSLPFIGIVGSIAGIFGKQVPAITRELLSLLTIDNICEIDSVKNHFGFEPVRFSDALRTFLSP